MAKSITVIGRRWRDVHGNTYHTAEVVVDGVSERSGITYGYGTQYEETAMRLLEKLGHIDKADGYRSLWGACDALGIPYTSTVIDVARKRDL